MGGFEDKILKCKFSEKEKIITCEKNEKEKALERMRIEYERRKLIIKNALSFLGNSEELVILAPPVLDRTDFGYVADLDIVFWGDSQQEMDLFEKMNESEMDLFVIRYDKDRLVEISEKVPAFYLFLKERKCGVEIENYPNTEAGNFFDEAPELEEQIRKSISLQDKISLKNKRLRIGAEFINDTKKYLNVLGFCFSGSMVNNFEKFGINSDLDIDILYDSREDSLAFEFLHIYLKWKYAEEFGIKIDIGDTEIKSAKRMALRDKNLNEFYLKKFGIDVIKYNQ